MRSTTLFALGRAEHDAVPLHFRLLELCCGNRPVESGAQLLGRLQGQLDPREVPISGAPAKPGDAVYWSRDQIEIGLQQESRRQGIVT